MISPPYLKPGDAVAIVASARKISPDEIAFALKTIESWGLKPVLGKNLHAVQNQFAGSDEQRAADLQWAINDDSIKAIFFARGGYGTVRIVDAVDFSRFKPHPKWLVGYSDITVLHSHIHKFFYTATLHGTMPINFEKNAEATASLKKCLFGEPVKYEFASRHLGREGNTRGIVVGGNLSLLYALSGTPDELDTTGKILFIEDLDEYLYHIDRMMLNLKRGGKLKNLAGLVVGGFTEIKDNMVPFGKTAEEIIYDAVKEYNFPVCFDFPAGHVDRNLALYFGKEAILSVEKDKCTLEYI